jgi:sulfatase maturation enzyme AslB (radical SAM superfamily)
MSAETADGFWRHSKIRDLKGKDEIKVVFYGGEPLSMDMIINISEKMRAVAGKKSCAVFFHYQRHAPTALWKIEALEGAGVTSTGPGRCTMCSGPSRREGSFDVIVKNIQDVCSLIDVQVGGNYTRDRTNFRWFLIT